MGKATLAPLGVSRATFHLRPRPASDRDPAAGRARLAAARAPWRAAQVENVRGGCLAALGRRAEARAALAASEPAILAKWKAGELYGHAALERRRRAASR